MKKIFSILAAALVSMAAMAGANDLLWDFTETAPGSSPVASSNNPNVTLTYASKVNDATGTNYGLKGIKLDGSGYCYFTKAAVAGKLKLTFGPRKNTNASSLEVFTWSGETPAAETSIGVTGEQTESGTQIINLTAEQTHIYIKRKLSNETVLQKIQFIEDVARSFVDFELVMCNMSAEYDFSTLPSGVTASGTFDSDQHGYRAFTITVPVDGVVRFTISDCSYGNQPINVKNSAGTTIATLTYPKAGCYSPSNPGNVFQYIYLGNADVLTFENIQYCNYFKAEAADIVPCEVIYKDQNGTELGRFPTYEGASLETIPYTESDLPAIGEGYVFRGWFYSSGKKAVVGDPITGNTTIQAKVTPVETVTVGSVQVYDFTNPYFYPEDHETIEMNGGYYHDAQHGWAFTNGEQFAVGTTGKKAIIVLEICQHGTEGAIWKETYVTPEVPGVVTPESCAAVGTEGQQITFKFDYNADEPIPVVFTLQSTGGENYLHKVTVYNVEDFMEKDEATGYFIVPAGDVASFLLALAQAQSGDKIFLPNGVYDLGETCLTTIAKDNIALIGQSMEGVIIKNAPDAMKESIDKTATIKINKNVKNTYLQDLTIQNALDYYKNNNGRAVALWDQGTQTVCKNVRLLSYQDTYYSNLQGALKYFEDCEIHGTVDFICGDGSVYFKNNLLYCEKRNSNGGGSDALTANNGPATDKGYVFEGCTVKSECPTVSMGRAWNGTPSVAFLNTLVDYSAGQFSFSDGNKIERWTKELMNKGAWPQFGEYNTHLADGTVLTPVSNVVTFIDTKDGNATQDIETVLSAEQAAAYTMEYTLGAWAETAAADAAQAVCDLENIEDEGIYLVESLNGNAELMPGSQLKEEVFPEDAGITVRKANARGGFGAKVGKEIHEGIENTAASNGQIEKIVRNGQLYILRGNTLYTATGQVIR